MNTVWRKIVVKDKDELEEIAHAVLQIAHKQTRYNDSRGKLIIYSDKCNTLYIKTRRADFLIALEETYPDRVMFCDFPSMLSLKLRFEVN